MALDGSVGEFNPAREDWNTYVECLKFYFEANGVEAAAKKRSIFLSTSGAERFKLVCSLAAPSTPRELTFAQLVDLLNEHYNPKKAAAVQRYKFNSRISQPGESIATYVAGLKKLAVHYRFEEDTMKQMLCDRLVCGINDSRMQRRLLTELELNFDKAFALIQALESADQSTADLEKTHTTASPLTGSGIYRVLLADPPRNPKKRTQPEQCYCCGGKHYASDCRLGTQTAASAVKKVTSLEYAEHDSMYKPKGPQPSPKVHINSREAVNPKNTIRGILRISALRKTERPYHGDSNHQQ